MSEYYAGRNTVRCGTNADRTSANFKIIGAVPYSIPFCMNALTPHDRIDHMFGLGNLGNFAVFGEFGVSVLKTRFEFREISSLPRAALRAVLCGAGRQTVRLPIFTRY